MRRALVTACVVFGVIAGMFPQLFGGDGMADTANRMPTPFVPAGYAFSIWGLIFLGHLAFAVYQWRHDCRRFDWLVALNSVLSGSWTILYSYHLWGAAWACMLCILATLIAVVLRIGHQRGRAYWLVEAPFHTNLAWISVATMANTAQFLRYQVGFDGAPFTPITWAAILMVLAAALAIALVLRRRDYAFGLVVVWALIAIAVKGTLVAVPIVMSIAIAVCLGARAIKR